MMSVSSPFCGQCGSRRSAPSLPCPQCGAPPMPPLLSSTVPMELETAYQSAPTMLSAPYHLPKVRTPGKKLAAFQIMLSLLSLTAVLLMALFLVAKDGLVAGFTAAAVNRPTPAATANGPIASPTVAPTPTFIVTTKNLSIPCGDCDQPKITVVLQTIAVNQSQQETLLTLLVTNGTAQDDTIQFLPIKLRESSGEEHQGKWDPFFVGAGQAFQEPISFDVALQTGVSYTLLLNLTRSGRWMNSYQPVAIAG